MVRNGGCVLRRGAGRRRGGQRPAPVRYRAGGSGPGCPATCGENPVTLSGQGAALPDRSAPLPCTSRASSRPWLGLVGLARRRYALEAPVQKVVMGGQGRAIHEQ